MSPHDLSCCRSVLFLPASNPRAIVKARTLAADMIVLDLEDAVREEDKAGAREAAVAALAEGFGAEGIGAEGFGDRPVGIRVNAVGTLHHGEDMIAARRCAAAFVVLPKAEAARDLVDTARIAERPVLAMVETPRGVLAAGELAGVAGALIAGTNDLAAMLGLPAEGARAGLVTALQLIVLAARAAGVPAFDGVYNRLEDEAGLIAEAGQGRGFGFDGKSVIHPAQIDAVNRAFSPSDEEVAVARALVAAATGGAERHEGRMIEALHVAQARTLLAKARR